MTQRISEHYNIKNHTCTVLMESFAIKLQQNCLLMLRKHVQLEVVVDY